MTTPLTPASAAGNPDQPAVRHPVDEEKLRKVEGAISAGLRIGVLLSVAILLVGLVVTFLHHPDYRHITGGISYHELTSKSTRFPHTVSQMGSALSRGDGEGIIVLGLIVLVATPVFRVAIGVLSFIYEKDPPMTFVTLFVLAVLLLSFFLA